MIDQDLVSYDDVCKLALQHREQITFLLFLLANVGEGLRRTFAMPNPFVLTNKICLNQVCQLFPSS